MPDYFVKSESSVSLTSGTLGNYTGAGVKHSNSNGSFEGMLAFKINETSKVGFVEFKYTTPKKHDLAFESRTRVQLESSGNSITTRFAGKFSKDIGKNFNIYEIIGASAKFSLNGKGIQSITPVSLTGVGYNINKKLSCYTEIELSKSYNPSSKSWGAVAPSSYLGFKYTF